MIRYNYVKQTQIIKVAKRKWARELKDRRENGYANFKREWMKIPMQRLLFVYG